MTAEQFVFWISGYLTAGRNNDESVIVEDIIKALKEVKNESIPKITLWTEYE